ncbi:MAG: hypothetical protein JRJ87_08220 [Deltaproteobacteria bacterium]|nr:hypothetical protein [Deltaproteobacteria bacterium]
MKWTLPIFCLLIAVMVGCSDTTMINDEPLADADAGSTDAAIDAGNPDGGPDGQADGQGDGDIDGYSDGQSDGYSDADGYSDGQADGKVDGYADGKPDGTGDLNGDSQPANEIWVEIDYSSAYSPQSPDWSFSDTPGWGPAEWATTGNTWPEAWDRWNNMAVVDDPIGRSLEIGPGGELQLMLGFHDLISYDSVTVRIEGRSRNCCARVFFDVYNPLNGLGDSSELGQQWEVQVVELDMGQCFEIGQGVQAVRVDPTSGSIALVRMRVTIHNPVY